jgi:hypothetical protein
MVHRITYRTNPRLYLLAGISILLILGGLIALAFLGVLIGGIILVVTGFIAYSLFKFLRSVLKSNVNTYDDGLTFTLSSGSKERFTWERITHAGKCRDRGGKESLFIYQEDEDRFMAVTEEFTDFPKLEKEIKEKTEVPFREHDLEEKETIQDYLRKLADIPDASDASDASDSKDQSED